MILEFIRRFERWVRREEILPTPRPFQGHMSGDPSCMICVETPSNVPYGSVVKHEAIE